jgi:HPt (histidine-containing phosphotransfer) domain-containing protein
VTSNNDELSIDLSVLESLRDFQPAGEPDFVTELIDLFLRDTTWQIQLVRTAVANNDVNEFRRLAHLVKGSSGNIGAKKLATICEEMENTDLPESVAASLLEELENEFELVSTLLNKERQW